jgi:uncharacterized protein DUF6152
MRPFAVFPTLALAFLVAAVVPAAAHHSFAAFDMTNQKTITGAVKQVDWTNPHIWIWIDVANDKGGSDTYAFEGMSPNFLARRGWTRSTLHTGDKITISYRPMKDGKNGGMFISGTMASGKVLTMGGAADGNSSQK